MQTKMVGTIAMSTVEDELCYARLRRVRFLIRAFDGVVDSEWEEARRTMRNVVRKETEEEDDDEVDSGGEVLSQDDFLRMGVKPAWWKEVQVGVRNWWKRRRRKNQRDRPGEREDEVKEEEGVEDSPDARVMGVGLWGELTGRELDPSGAPYRVRLRHARICQRLDRRPFFTYWVCAVQTVALLLVLAANSGRRAEEGEITSTLGLAPFGLGGLAHRSGLVLTEFLTLEQVDVFEPASFWLGPGALGLVRAGAGFAPCMRPRSSSALSASLAEARAEERSTGCCVRNDGSGCAQTLRRACSRTLSTFTPGTVCGLDPAACGGLAAWEEDFTKWPTTCRVGGGRRNRTEVLVGAPTHLQCDVVARPCCIGIHGRCELRSRDFCDWVGGTFHPEAALCSQVSCMTDVCGMLPFFLFGPDRPDQLYRLLTCTLVPAGLAHLLLALAFQLAFLRDLEMMLGAARAAAVYLVSGAFGTLVSAALVDAAPESGPSGAVFGVVGLIFVEAYRARSVLRRPWRAIAILAGVVAVFALCGLFPWVDNFAHLSGLAMGAVVSMAVVPTLEEDTGAARVRRALWGLGAAAAFALVLGGFLASSESFCQPCRYLSCVPLQRDFCAEQKFHFDKRQRYF